MSKNRILLSASLVKIVVDCGNKGTKGGYHVRIVSLSHAEFDLRA